MENEERSVQGIMKFDVRCEALCCRCRTAPLARPPRSADSITDHCWQGPAAPLLQFLVRELSLQEHKVSLSLFAPDYLLLRLSAFKCIYEFDWRLFLGVGPDWLHPGS